MWFTAQTHRHEPPGPNSFPGSLQGLSELFDVAIQLQPEGKNIHLQILKGAMADRPNLLLDPGTMLIKNHV